MMTPTSNTGGKPASADPTPPLPGGVILISAPSRDGLFKRTARIANVLTVGHSNRKYYADKDARLDAAGFPIMNDPVGNGHVSEMTMEELRGLLAAQGLQVEKIEMMPIMSGSKWFDRHLFLLSVLAFAEALHSVFRFSSWAHSARMMVRVPEKTSA